MSKTWILTYEKSANIHIYIMLTYRRSKTSGWK